MNKVITANQAAKLVKDGSTIMIGGFLSCGTPDIIIDELVKENTKNLTLICNDTSFQDADKGKLVKNNQIKKVITTHIGTNPVTGEKMNSGEIEVEFYPMGTLIEKIHAKGAGLGGVLTPTGIGTILEEGKKIVEVNNKKYIFEEPLGADVALIYGTRVDKFGNVSFEGTTRNFNPAMATAADIVVVQADKFVENLDPNEVIIPGLFIDYIVYRGEN